MELQARVLLFFLLCLSATFGSAFSFDSFQASNFTVRDPYENATVVCDHSSLYKIADIRKVLRKWYVLEIYMHLANEGQKLYKSCPVTTIWETDDFPRTTFGVGVVCFLTSQKVLYLHGKGSF